MGFMPFIAGIFLATYANNQKFKSQVDGIIKNTLAKGVDMLNAKGVSGGEPDDTEPSPEE